MKLIYMYMYVGSTVGRYQSTHQPSLYQITINHHYVVINVA